MHGITVACHHLLSCCIYTDLVSLILDTSIPTYVNILMKVFFTLVSLIFHCKLQLTCQVSTFFVLWHLASATASDVHILLMQVQSSNST